MWIEPLEARQLMSASLPVVQPMFSALPQASSSYLYGLSPAQTQTAYAFNQVLFQGGTVAGKGEGQTIAIVDAYSDPQIAGDLATFDTQFGVRKPTSFNVVNQTGGTSNLPAADAGWGMEIALDVEWAHAIAPKAGILLVEASTAGFNDLMTAVNYAKNAAGVSVVSMSWGSNEFAGEAAYNNIFTSPAQHNGVTFVASSGDSGSASGPSFPAVVPSVLAVGGTTLNLDSSGQYNGETGWTGSTGGVSKFETVPTYQTAAQSNGHRTSPDVSYDANPNTGFAVYDSMASGWLQVGGTSAGAPQWAALIAIANQGRAFNGLPTLDGLTGTLPGLYSMYGNAASYTGSFHDVTSGSTSPKVAAGQGYDQVTGLGSPKANTVVQGLIGGGNANHASAPVINTPAQTTTFGKHNAFAAVAFPAPAAAVDAATLVSGNLKTGSQNLFSATAITLDL